MDAHLTHKGPHISLIFIAHRSLRERGAPLESFQHQYFRVGKGLESLNLSRGH